MRKRPIAPLLDEGLDLCVCIPARNEAARLPVLFRGLAAQSRPGPIKVIVALNNTTDDSHQVISQARSDYCGLLSIHVEETTFAAELAHAGSARRLAMDAGLTLLPSHEHGVLVSTDADTCPPPHWLDNMVRAFARGADLVGGRIAIDTAEELPKNVLALRQAWEAYWETVRAIEDSLDPLPWNPAPRHGDHTGASLALRACLYTRCGGVPLLRTGEDRALVAAAIAHGGRLAHPADVFTWVSPRRKGRAEGGMAQAMQDLFDLAASGSSPRAPGFEHWQERAKWRQRLRSRPEGHRRIAREEPLLPPMPHDMVLEVPS